MCRGINTERIKLSQLKADGDCIIFDFKVTKKKKRRSMFFVIRTINQSAVLKVWDYGYYYTHNHTLMRLYCSLVGIRD